MIHYLSHFFLRLFLGHHYLSGLILRLRFQPKLFHHDGTLKFLSSYSIGNISLCIIALNHLRLFYQSLLKINRHISFRGHWSYWQWKWSLYYFPFRHRCIHNDWPWNDMILWSWWRNSYVRYIISNRWTLSNIFIQNIDFFILVKILVFW